MIEKFAWKIRYYRESNGLTQEELGRDLGGVSSSTIANWERGRQFPKSHVMISMLTKKGLWVTGGTKP